MLLQKLKIDDPVDASPVHGFCGIWGVLACGFLRLGQGRGDLVSNIFLFLDVFLVVQKEASVWPTWEKRSFYKLKQ